jgi:hypothetical protein
MKRSYCPGQRPSCQEVSGLALQDYHAPRPAALLDEPPPLGVGHRLEAVVGAELTVDVVEMVAELLPSAKSLRMRRSCSESGSTAA